MLIPITSSDLLFKVLSVLDFDRSWMRKFQNIQVAATWHNSLIIYDLN